MRALDYFLKRNKKRFVPIYIYKNYMYMFSPFLKAILKKLMLIGSLYSL